MSMSVPDVPVANDGDALPAPEAAWNEQYGQDAPVANDAGPLPSPAIAWNEAFTPADKQAHNNQPAGGREGPLPVPAWDDFA